MLDFIMEGEATGNEHAGLSRKAERQGEKRAWRSDYNMGRKGKLFIKEGWEMLGKCGEK